MSEEQKLIEETTNCLGNVAQGELQDRNDEILKRFADKLSINKSLFLNHSNKLQKLVLAAVNVLYTSDLPVDYDLVVEIISQVLSSYKFDEIISIFSIDQISQALSSPNDNLQVLAVKIISTATSMDIKNNVNLVLQLLSLMKTAHTKVQNEIENCFKALLYDSATRAVVTSAEGLKILEELKGSDDTVINCRYYDFLTELSQFITENEIPAECYTISQLDSDDILFVISLISFVKNILVICNSTLDRKWLFEIIANEVAKISNIYIQIDDHLEIKAFAINDIHEVFKQVSLYSIDAFKKLNIVIDIGNIDLLSRINPEYLNKYQPETLQSLKLSIKTLPVFINLVSNEESFKLIELEITTSKLLKLSYLELMEFLLALAQYQYSTKYLSYNLPQIMNKLIDGSKVIEPECFKLRKLVLERLITYPEEVLNVWKVPLYAEYFKLTQGESKPAQAAVADMTL